MLVLAEVPPKVDIDKIPREITVRAGKTVDLDIPYTGKYLSSVIYIFIINVIYFLQSSWYTHLSTLFVVGFPGRHCNGIILNCHLNK